MYFHSKTWCKLLMFEIPKEKKMKLTNLKQRRQEAGFTLVELAIVMIIIGLLIGGILKGQELVANAQLTASVAQIKGLDGALSTFRDKYSALPGDMAGPNVRLRDCAAAPCSTAPATSNGVIDTPNLGAVPTLTSEGVVAFVQMAAADLISGVSVVGATLNFGSALPEAKIGGGYWLGHTQNGSAAGGIAGMRPGHYLVMNGQIGAVAAASTTGITSTQAAQIDRKIDDGNPDTGDVQATGSSCRIANLYQEAIVTASCSLYIRVQG
jgi:prepilin-type N-terminal cleavage/methylation domain-containing protein